MFSVSISRMYEGNNIFLNPYNICKNVKIIRYAIVFYMILSDSFSSEVLRPHGVSLSRAPLYSPHMNFTCFDNSKAIPFSQVNDDYCDCPDGSDEPGTSACPNGFFYCSNAGYKPLNLISSRVNDGICDCCDGSDEYGSSKVSCPNTCFQLGQNAREEAQRMAEVIKVGKQIKTQLIEQGVQLKQKRKNRLIELEKLKEEAEKVRDEKQSIKDDIEAIEKEVLDKYRKLEEEEKERQRQIQEEENKKEAVEHFNIYDVNHDDVLDVNELKQIEILDKDHNKEVSDDELQHYLNGQDTVDRETFITYVWPDLKLNLMKDSGMFQGQEQLSDPENPEIDHEEKLTDEPSHPEDEEEEDEDEEHDAEEVEETEDKKESHNISYDPETQNIINQATAARNDFNTAQKSLEEIDNEIKSIQQQLDKDYGVDEEFATLEEQCFEYQDHEYIYKLCVLQKATQQSIAGGAETKLGSWGRWDGPENNKYEVMIYDRGQSCWNGPQRSVKVKVSCGVDNKILSVSEPNRCEYLFEFSTPAACKELTADMNEDLHDEL